MISETCFMGMPKKVGPAAAVCGAASRMAMARARECVVGDGAGNLDGPPTPHPREIGLWDTRGNRGSLFAGEMGMEKEREREVLGKALQKGSRRVYVCIRGPCTATARARGLGLSASSNAMAPRLTRY